MQLSKVLAERAIQAEMAERLGHTWSDPVANSAGDTLDQPVVLRILKCRGPLEVFPC